MQKFIKTVLCGTSLAALATVQAATTPYGVAVKVGSDIITIPAGSSVNNNVETWTIPTDTTIAGDGYEVNMSMMADTDPFLSWGITVQNVSSSTTTFTFLFGTPIVPTGPDTTVSSSVSGGLTDIEVDGVSMGLGVGATIVQSFLLSPQTSMGLDIGPAASFGPTIATETYGPYSSGPIAGPSNAALWDQLQVLVSFTLSGHDQAVLNGVTRVETAIRTPDGGAGMIGLGTLLLLPWFGRKAQARA